MGRKIYIMIIWLVTFCLIYMGISQIVNTFKVDETKDIFHQTDLAIKREILNNKPTFDDLSPASIDIKTVLTDTTPCGNWTYNKNRYVSDQSCYLNIEGNWRSFKASLHIPSDLGIWRLVTAGIYPQEDYLIRN